MEKGQDEYGPISLIFDLIEADIAAGLNVLADGYVVGMSRALPASGPSQAEGEGAR